MSEELDPKLVRELQNLVDVATSPRNEAELIAGVYGVMVAIDHVGTTTDCDPAVLFRQVFGDETYEWAAETMAHFVAEMERNEGAGSQ